MNDISNAEPGSQVKLFADDTNLFIFCSSLGTVFINANNYVRLLNDWFRCNKLSINVAKTNYNQSVNQFICKSRLPVRQQSIELAAQDHKKLSYRLETGRQQRISL